MRCGVLANPLVAAPRYSSNALESDIFLVLFSVFVFCFVTKSLILLMLVYLPASGDPLFGFQAQKKKKNGLWNGSGRSGSPNGPQSHHVKNWNGSSCCLTDGGKKDTNAPKQDRFGGDGQGACFAFSFLSACYHTAVASAHL
jgi:hypothetical protein